VFTVTEFNPYRNWKWVAGFLWLTCHYDHRFEELNPTQTKLTWVIEASGFGKSVIGRLFAKIYRKSLDRAIPLLVEQMERKSSASAGGGITRRCTGPRPRNVYRSSSGRRRGRGQ
jgi:hypothetical protein